MHGKVLDIVPITNPPNATKTFNSERVILAQASLAIAYRDTSIGPNKISL